MELSELYCPQIAVHVGAYAFAQGIEIEVHSAETAHSDWAKIRFTEQFQSELSLTRRDRAAIELGYNDALYKVFSGYVSKPYNSGGRANEVSLRDESLLLEDIVVNDTFLDTTPQELISHFLAQAGISRIELDTKDYPRRAVLPIRRQNALQDRKSVV